MKLINLARIDFGGITRGKSKPEERFDVQPTTSDQTITPTEGSVFSGGTVRAVTKEIDVNIVSNNIKEGVTILGVAGTLKEEKPEESFDVQPTTTEQTITPTAGSVFSGGTVHAVTSAIDSNIQPENIKQGVSILGVAGTLSGGGGSDVFVVPDGMKFSNSTITEIPSNFDFSNVTDMDKMFENCSNLTTIPQLDTSKVTSMSEMFYSCSSLTSISHLDTSKVTNMSSMFSYCGRLNEMPLLDTSKVTNMSNMCYGCAFQNIPQLDTSKVTNMYAAFSNCFNLTTCPQLDTSNATEISYIFDNCLNLTAVEGIDFSGCTSSPGVLFGFNFDMPNLTHFIVNGKINVSISDDYSIKVLTAIDYDSVKSILTAASNTDNTNAKELAFNRTMTDQNGELAALVSSCTSKGWTISGLTLQ